MLRKVAQLLGATLRDSDIVARYGGDEFVLMLPGAGIREVEIIARRLVENARSSKVDSGSGTSFGITLSLGIATHDASTGFGGSQELLAAADAALYHSKRNGRDQLTSYEQIRAA